MSDGSSFATIEATPPPVGLIEPTRRCKTCSKPLVRKHRYNSDGKPNGREPLMNFLARETCGRKCQTWGGKAQWRDDEKVALRALYPYFPAPMIAKALGKGRIAVLRMAEFEGLRKTTRGRSNAASFAQSRRRQLARQQVMA